MATGSFYTFSKRKSSTLQPTGSGTQIDLQLKSGTSLISPTFLISHSGRPTYNYVTYEGRNYFVNDVTSVRNDLWEVSCTEDFLGSWKSDIGTTSAYILYATGGSGEIIDARIPTKSPIIVDSSQDGLSGLTINDTVFGTVILSITGQGSFGCYMMQYPDDLPNLMKNIGIWGNAEMTVELDALKEFVYGGSAGNNLRNAIALPFAIPASGQGALEQLTLGKYPCADAGGNPINGYRITSPIKTATASVTIPWQFSDWRRYNPYTKVFLYLPFFGMLSIATNEIINETTLSVLYSLNITSGDISAEIKGGSGRIIATANGNCAMTIPFGSANVSAGKVTSIVGTGVAAIAAIASGSMGAVAKAVSIGGSAAASAAGILTALGGENTGGGGLGGGSAQGLTKVVKCWTISRALSDSQSNVNPILGKPVMGVHTIGTYSGFVQTDGAQVAGNMFDQERDTINRFLDGGIYYE